jgi:hypothetical protein
MNKFYEEIANERGLTDSLWDENVKRFCITAGTAGNAEYKFFNFIWEGWAYSVILGIIHNRRLPLKGEKNQWGSLTIIKNRDEETFKSIILLTLSSVSDIQEYLDEPKKLVQAMNEFAKGGAEYISEIRNTPGQEHFFNEESDFINELLHRNSH